MAKHTVTVDANESQELCYASRGSDMNAYEMTVFATGEFGGGTITIQASPDGGATKVNLRDITGSVVAITADDVYNVRMGYAGKLGEEIKIYATMAGATDPDIVLTVFDNR